MTEVGSIVGTAQYLSPEQARGEVVGPPSDLYSVGIVLYEMLTGRVPFEGDSAVAIAMKHLSEEPVPPSVHAPGTPKALEQVVLRALSKDAGDRYQTAEEMSADLDRARRGVALSPRTEQMTRVIAPVHTAPQPRVEPARDATRVWDREVAAPVRRQPPPPPPAGRPRRARWPWILLALLVLAAGAVVAVALSGVIGGGNGTPTTVAPTVARVPSGLVGMDEAPATAKLQRAGLVANPVNRASKQPPGVVISVSPPGGRQVKVGSSVTLGISKGVTLVAVPKVTGMTLQEATAALTGKGLKVGNQTETNDLAAAGTVIAQNPVAAATAPAGSSVALTISKGPKDVLVPDLTGQDLATAQQTLAGANLKPGTIRRVPSNDQPAGSVLSNDPPGGTQAPEGSAVNMVLSSGPKKVTMPEVYGLKSAEAAQLIQDAGLVPRTPSSFPTNDPALDDTVRKTSPQPGTPVRQGSNVIISVYRYAAPSTDTVPTDTTTAPVPPDTTSQGQNQNP
jgi:serine/threonine-protein kinase